MTQEEYSRSYTNLGKKMGDSNRRKTLDPNYGQKKYQLDILSTSSGVLTVYSSNKDLYSTDFIKPDLDLSNFSTTTPHSVCEWQSNFFKYNEESKAFDKLDSIVARITAHAQAFKVYLERKIKKNIVKNPEAFTLQNYLDMQLIESTTLMQSTIFGTTEKILRLKLAKI